MNRMENALPKLLLFTAVLLIVGVGFGALLVLVLNADQRSQLLDELSVFYGQGAATDDMGWLALLSDELRSWLLAWVLGLSCVGFPVILALVFIKGLAIGFTVGFFVYQWLWKGALLAGVSVLPHNLFFVPAHVLSAAFSIHFSLMLLSLLFRKETRKVRTQWLRYNAMMLAVTVLFVLGGLVEAYVTVPLLAWVTKAWF